ncbi:MAG: hypothetical protein RBR35_09405 [Salinivirgaceae bacterium]|nr:hypothetical protein [Salinivirgaceae bacterium]
MSATKKRIDSLEATMAAMQAEAEKPSLSLFGRLKHDADDSGPTCRAWDQPNAMTKYKALVFRGSFGAVALGCPVTGAGPHMPGSGPEEVERPCLTCKHWR